jgi:hypothetical protein
VHADGAVVFAAAAEQAAEREVQLDCLGSTFTTSMKASIALSGCSFSRKLRPLK